MPRPERKLSDATARDIILTDKTISVEKWAAQLRMATHTIWKVRKGMTYKDVYRQVERERYRAWKSHAKQDSTPHSDVLKTSG
jgi:rRNA processing protein Krr1/Pno1